MKPVEFKHQNVVFAKDQPQYRPLPALKLNDDIGTVISCWKMSFWQRIKVLFTGRVWLSLASFGKPLTPSLLSVNQRDIFVVKKQKPKSIKRLTLRGVIVWVQYLLWAIKRINEPHLGDMVVYQDKKYFLTQGVMKPYWDMVELNGGSSLKRVHEDDFKLCNPIQGYYQRLVTSIRFQLSSWYFIDTQNKGLFKRISYTGD